MSSRTRPPKRARFVSPATGRLRSARRRRAQPALAPIDISPSFKHQAYAALKNAIVAMDIYRSRDDIRLDERKLAQDFGISRTPVREAMAQLESEGFVRSVPRRGIYVVRKTKTRSDRDDHRLGGARKHGGAPDHADRQRRRDRRPAPACSRHSRTAKLRAHLDEYSEVNIEFHQTHHPLSRNHVLIDLAENLFTHMRMIRRKTIGEKDRADRSIRDHMNIIEALEARDTDRAEELVRDHALGLAEHVAQYADYLD